MNPLKLENVSFSHVNGKYNVEILGETLKLKRYIDEILVTTKNSSEIYKTLTDLFLLSKDGNGASFLNYLKDIFVELTSNQKLDILYNIYKELDPKVVEVFFKEINLHKLTDISESINRTSRWDKIFLYIHPEHKENSINLKNNTEFSKFINIVNKFDGNIKPHKDYNLLEELSKLVNKRFIKDFVYNFNI